MLRQGGSDSLDLTRGYVQWAWYPAGLHLEVGDGQDYARPLDDQVWESLRWLGWMPPDDVNRNAWFEAEGDGAAEVAYDLVTRTLSVLRQGTPAVDVHDLFPPDFEPVPEWNVNPDGVDLDGPHYHDPDGEGLCMFCEAPAKDPQHWPPVVAFAPASLGDGLEETRQAAVNWATAHMDGPLVIIDLLDAFPTIPGQPVDEVAHLIDSEGIEAAAARLRASAADTPVRISLSVADQTEGLMEGLPRPFEERPTAGTALAALADTLSRQFTQVLICTLWVVGDDPFFAGLADMPATQWLRGRSPHPFTPTPTNRDECYWCPERPHAEIHTKR